MTTGKVLIVDDQEAVRTALELLFEVHGIEALTARGPTEALDLIARDDVGCVIQDMNFTDAATSGEEGMRLLDEIRALDPALPVVLMTAWTSVETAVAMMKRGARDYIAKPWNDARLLTTVRNLLRMRELDLENRRLVAAQRRARDSLAARYDLQGMVFASPAMHEVVALAAKVAPADVPVLVLGPNGAGKEHIADVLHANSRRRAGPLVKVNVGAVPEALFASELFGVEAGAFTSAAHARAGRFEEAHGGTLFLDELGTLDFVWQVALLRVLQSGEFQRLGSNRTRRADVRVVAATNADLPRMVREGAFREDLYYRLAVIELRVPPLRARVDDVLPLAEHFLSTLAPRPTPTLTDGARAALLAHDWPGNVRELRNRIQRALLVRGGEALTAEDLGLAGASAQRVERSDPPPEGELREERASVEQALARAGGVVSRAAAELGLSRQALYRRMERLGLAVERRVRA
ncbi:MAG: sigma-54 dependent transcriptional regulator [Polyangiales bacterium]